VAIQHLRGLAKYGILTDPDPYDLPPQAFSAGVNVRFRNGRVTGGPVWRNALTLGTVDPRFAVASNPATGLDLLFVGYSNGTISRIANNVETAYSIAGYTPVVADTTWTTTTLANVVYVNRADRAPWYFRPTDTQFHDLGVVSGAPASWDSTWTCKLLRTCGGALVALNVTKGATASPTMVKTSSIPTAGIIPTSWDQSIPATLATENILADMQGPINDACRLGSNLIIYGLSEAWVMTPAQGASSVFNYDKLPFKKGSLNANCSVEIDGNHYVMGPDDIWMHDGVSEVSLCDQKTRDFIFQGLNLSKARRCFVTHNPLLKEITFSYPSSDRLISFFNTDGCNRQAVYNYIDKTWTFDDCPNVYSAAYANLSNSLTWDTITTTYDTTGGSWLDQEDGFKRTITYVGSSNSTYSLATSLYAFDVFGQGSTVTYTVDTNANKPRYLERDGIDLDEVGVDLVGYKVCSTIYPQARLGSGAANLMIDAGSSDGYNVSATFSGYQPYNGNDLYKLDYNVAGRYLSLRIKFSDYRELSISGFDLDLKITGKPPV